MSCLLETGDGHDVGRTETGIKPQDLLSTDQNVSIDYKKEISEVGNDSDS